MFVSAVLKKQMSKNYILWIVNCIHHNLRCLLKLGGKSSKLTTRVHPSQSSQSLIKFENIIKLCKALVGLYLS